VTVQDILELGGAGPDSGVLLGEIAIELDGVLAPDREYECDGEIVDVERKQGARAGVFDRLTFVVHVRESAGADPVASCTYTWIFPRRGA
jgi:hypothetical protein